MKCDLWSVHAMVLLMYMYYKKKLQVRGQGCMHAFRPAVQFPGLDNITEYMYSQAGHGSIIPRPLFKVEMLH